MNESWWDHRILWAVFTLGAIGLLRGGDFALDEAEHIDSQKLLRMRDITSESSNGRTVLKVRLFNTKTDRNNQGVQVIIGGTGRTVCAVSAMCAYLRVRSSADPKAPLFIFQDGAILRRKTLIIFVRAFLDLIGESSQQYAGHSFRVGGASDLAAANVPDYEIQAAGRWTSEAFKRYLRFSDGQNAQRSECFGLGNDGSETPNNPRQCCLQRGL